MMENSNVTTVAEALVSYFSDTTTIITTGDLILSSDILVKLTQAVCSRNNQVC